VDIELLTSDEWQRYRSLRLASLADSPDAFGTTLAAARTLTEVEWKNRLIELPTLVAALDEVDVGTVRVATDDTDSTAAYLISMWVAPEARGRQIGESLIQSAISLARSKNYRMMSLDVADNNTAAISLYERMGFEPNGETGTLPEPRTHVSEHRRVLYL